MTTLFLLLVGLFLVQAVDLQVANDAYTPRSCNSPIYCEGPLLKTVQLARPYPDSKTFVDMPTSKPVDQVLKAFEALGDHPDKASIKTFIDGNFGEPASELKPYNVTVEPLAWLDKVDDLTYRGWVDILHHAWGQLSFEFDYSQLCEGCVSSTLPAKRPFVLPGGRFREFYYWDSFFVIEGLLKSNLDSLALGMLDNFLDFVDTYGFMPNGARIYYLNRSQPPFLTEMVKIYFEKTKDLDFLKRALPVLDKEYSFWQNNKTTTIRKDGKKYKLSRYDVENHSPRPESYYEDYNTVYNGTDFNLKQQNDLFSDLASGAETGWDYSSRWTKVKEYIPDSDILRTLNTRNVIPVELNALLWSMETTLAGWYEKHGSTVVAGKQQARKSNYYRKQANQRLDAMDALLWNHEQSSFFDYNITSQAQDETYSPAALYPFWLGALPARVREPSTLLKVFDLTHGLLAKYPGILTSSVYNTTMQWDFPNGWPPLQYIAINAMLNVDKWLQKTKYTPVAKVLAERTAASSFCSWYLTGGSVPGSLQKLSNTTDDGHMFEKFDVRSLTASGFGGEYTVQVGFGWTNGVVLWIFDKFGGLKAPDCKSSNIYPVPDLK